MAKVSPGLNVNKSLKNPMIFLNLSLTKLVIPFQPAVTLSFAKLNADEKTPVTLLNTFFAPSFIPFQVLDMNPVILPYMSLKNLLIDPPIDSVPSNPNILPIILKTPVITLSRVFSRNFPIPPKSFLIPPRISPFWNNLNASPIDENTSLILAHCLRNTSSTIGYISFTKKSTIFIITGKISSLNTLTSSITAGITLFIKKVFSWSKYLLLTNAKIAGSKSAKAPFLIIPINPPAPLFATSTTPPPKPFNPFLIPSKLVRDLSVAAIDNALDFASSFILPAIPILFFFSNLASCRAIPAASLCSARFSSALPPAAVIASFISCSATFC